MTQILCLLFSYFLSISSYPELLGVRTEVRPTSWIQIRRIIGWPDSFSYLRNMNSLYSIAVSNHVWIHSANPLFNIQRNTLTVPTFSCVNKISLISMEYKNMSFHVYLTPPFSARNSIVLSFVWFQCNTLLTSIHLSIYPSYLHTVKKFRTMLDHFNFGQKKVSENETEILRVQNIYNKA